MFGSREIANVGDSYSSVFFFLFFSIGYDSFGWYPRRNSWGRGDEGQNVSIEKRKKKTKKKTTGGGGDLLLSQTSDLPNAFVYWHASDCTKFPRNGKRTMNVVRRGIVRVLCTQCCFDSIDFTVGLIIIVVGEGIHGFTFSPRSMTKDVITSTGECGGREREGGDSLCTLVISSIDRLFKSLLHTVVRYSFCY